jgi:hypothetical protein
MGQIKFDGLMVGRYDEKRRVYQLGVLPAAGHKFTICYQINGPKRDGAFAVTLPDERGIWRLGIANRQADAELFFSETEPDRQNPPGDVSSPEAMDFGWVLDIEGDEFPDHPKPMPLIPGNLKPIFHIRNGVIFNANLTMRLKRTVGGRNEESFGAASNAIGVDLDVMPGEVIFLRNVETGEDIFRIMVEPKELVRVFINNIPPDEHTLIPGHSDTTFHFRMYYDTFDVEDNKRYDFSITDENAPQPHHHGGTSSADPAAGHFLSDSDEHHHHGSGNKPEANRSFAAPEPAEDSKPSCTDGRGAPGMMCGTTHLSISSKSLR